MTEPLKHSVGRPPPPALFWAPGKTALVMKLTLFENNGFCTLVKSTDAKSVKSLMLRNFQLLKNLIFVLKTALLFALK